MKFGVVFPHLEIGQDPAKVKDFVQAVEGLGYDYLLTYEEIVETNPDKRTRWREPLTLLSFIAGVTTTLELTTGIIVLPSRQTLLVAKQAAELDLLSGGRLRLGFSVGWNQKEYQAMGVDIAKRGKRIEEQVAVLRELWTKDRVTFKGNFHTLDGVAIDPLPIQQPIPIWFGGQSDVTLRRVARIGDGWMTNPFHVSLENAKEEVDKLHRYAREAGRKPDEIGLNVIGVTVKEVQEQDRFVERWRDLGATHMDVITMERGLATIQDHIEAIRQFKTLMG
jgi:probable F420-dependent oxidoreductase